MYKKQIKYSKNFLKNVIFRVDFSPILRIKSSENISPFQELIRQDYPKTEIKQLFTKNVTISKENDSVTSVDFNQYEFKNVSRDRLVALSHTYLTVEFNKYETFNIFLNEIKKIYAAFEKCFENPDVTRLGLRYINEIKLESGNPLNWDGIINDSLINCKNNVLIKHGNLSRLISRSVFHEEGKQINFQFGLFNSEFPAPISRREFLLDFDCSSKEINSNQIIEKIEEFHDEIQKLYESSIGEKLRNILRGNNGD